MQFCVNQLCSVNIVPNVQTVDKNLPVGARLNLFGVTWEALGNGPKVLQILREGYTLPFQTRPNLTRSPTIISCCVKQERLPVGGISSADEQKCNRVGQKSRISEFLQLAIFGPKTKQQMETYTRSEQSQQIPQGGKFKMETPETIQASLQTREWVTSIDFKDAYLHMPIQNQSRKYLRFHVQRKIYQFQALPFGLSTAPLEFIVVAKEVKLMALQKGIKIHQYLDDWLVWARSYQTCLQHTQTLVALCQELGWLVNMEKSELEPNFVGYQFNLKEGKVRPTLDWWQTLTTKIRELLTGSICPIYRRHSNRKIGSPRSTPYESHIVAPQTKLVGPRITRKGDTSSQIAPHPHKVVAGGKQCAPRSTITPTKNMLCNCLHMHQKKPGVLT